MRDGSKGSNNAWSGLLSVLGAHDSSYLMAYKSLPSFVETVHSTPHAQYQVETLTTEYPSLYPAQPHNFLEVGTGLKWGQSQNPRPTWPY